MTLTLYFSPGACSFVPHVGLEVIRDATGTPFDTHRVKLHRNEQNQPDFLALNPDGQVPVLVVDDRALTQIVAIADYLDRVFPAAELLPQDTWERALALSRLAWFNNTVHPTFTHIFRPDQFAEDPNTQTHLRTQAIERYTHLLETIDALAPSEGYWLGGSRPSFHDAYAFTLLRWGGFAGIDPASLERYRAYVERVMAAPPVASAIERERIGLDSFKPKTEPS